MLYRRAPIRLATLLIFALCIMCVPGNAHAAGKESVYDRVMRTGEIRCGYVNWPPYNIVDPNTGQVTGIFYDYFEALGKLLNLKIIWQEEINFSTYLQDIKNGRFDMECSGGWPNAQRGKHAIYTKSIFYIPIVPFVRTSEARFKNLSAINRPNIKVSVIDGENAQTIRRIHFDRTIESSLPASATGTQMLLDVMTNKADVTFTDIYSGLEFSANNSNGVKPIFIEDPILLIPQNITLAPDAYRMREVINTATDELILSGQINKILDNYEKYPDAFYRLAKPYKVSQ